MYAWCLSARMMFVHMHVGCLFHLHMRFFPSKRYCVSACVCVFLFHVKVHFPFGCMSVVSSSVSVFFFVCIWYFPFVCWIIIVPSAYICVYLFAGYVFFRMHVCFFSDVCCFICRVCMLISFSYVYVVCVVYVSVLCSWVRIFVLSTACYVFFFFIW